MSYIYIYEKAAKIGVRENCLVIENEKQKLKKTVPIEGVENVIIFGEASLSTSCVKQLMERNINLTWLSTEGKFYGRLESTRSVNIERQRCQFKCGESEDFSLRLSKKIIYAKMKNQLTILRRYNRSRNEEIVYKNIDSVNRLFYSMDNAQEKEELLGYEGLAARYYYQALGAIVEPEFSFLGRNRQPPKDPFNSLLSFAYTLLMYDLYTAIVNKGLNPYASFLHSTRSGHPALCSDLMEEWRAVLCDSLALYVISKGIINIKDFEKPNYEGGVYLNREASKSYIGEYEKKVRTRAQYITYVDYAVSFRRAMEMQCMRLAKAVEEGDPEIYIPVIIR